MKDKIPEPKLRALHCPACGHVVGQGGILHAARIGWSSVLDWVAIKASIGLNGALNSPDFHGSVCERCPANERLAQKGRPTAGVSP